MLRLAWGNRWLILMLFSTLLAMAMAWRLLPLPPTRRVMPDGRIETWSRSFRLLPPSGWRVHKSAVIGCGPTESARIDYLTLGFFEVVDTQTSLRVR